MNSERNAKCNCITIAITTSYEPHTECIKNMFQSMFSIPKWVLFLLS